jgi:hypothetical protein
MAHVIKAKLVWFVGGVVVLAALYGVVIAFKRKQAGTSPGALSAL